MPSSDTWLGGASTFSAILSRIYYPGLPLPIRIFSQQQEVPWSFSALKTLLCCALLTDFARVLSLPCAGDIFCGFQPFTTPRGAGHFTKVLPTVLSVKFSGYGILLWTAVPLLAHFRVLCFAWTGSATCHSDDPLSARPVFPTHMLCLSPSLSTPASRRSSLRGFFVEFDYDDVLHGRASGMERARAISATVFFFFPPHHFISRSFLPLSLRTLYP